jgi:hypothetical protein
MKKLAIIGIVLSGLLLPLANAQAKPAGMTKAEYRGLMIQSEGLNQKYGVGQQPQRALIRQKLEEIGAWAVPSTVGQKPPARYSRQALIRQKLEEIGAWAVPSTATSTTVVASSSDGFDWNYAGIGVAFAAVLLLGAAGLATVRRHRHRPLAH